MTRGSTGPGSPPVPKLSIPEICVIRLGGIDQPIPVRDRGDDVHAVPVVPEQRSHYLPSIGGESISRNHPFTALVSSEWGRFGCVDLFKRAKMLGAFSRSMTAPPFVAPEKGGRMTPEIHYSESPYCVKIETATGQSITVPIAVLTSKQLEAFLQTEFKRLAQEAGVTGARVHVERAMAADYDNVIHEVAACLRSAQPRAQQMK